MERPSKKAIKAALDNLKNPSDGAMKSGKSQSGNENNAQHLSGSKAAKSRTRQKSI